MDDHDLVEHVARQFVRRHGAGAVDVLRERADAAREIAFRLTLGSTSLTPPNACSAAITKVSDE